MYEQTKVSVIVPTYRRDETLKIALNSLLEQTHKNLEIIIISDNADEEWNKKVRKVVKEINNINKTNKNIGIQVIFNDENLMSAKTRNIGIFASSGSYITFLDDDDYYLPKKIESQLSKMKDDQSDFSITNLKLFSYSGRNIDNRTRRNLEKYISNDMLMKYHLKYHLTGTNTLMYKSDYLKNIGGFEKNEIGDEFILMYKSILNEGKFSYYDECYVHAIIHKDIGGISSGKSKIQRENNVFSFKKENKNYLNKKDMRYINSRHYATLAYAYLRMNKLWLFVKNSVFSFFSSPISSIQILFYR